MPRPVSGFSSPGMTEVRPREANADTLQGSIDHLEKEKPWA